MAINSPSALLMLDKNISPIPVVAADAADERDGVAVVDADDDVVDYY